MGKWAGEHALTIGQSVEVLTSALLNNMLPHRNSSKSPPIPRAYCFTPEARKTVKNLDATTHGAFRIN
jgi:hypothetical protein